MCWTSWIVRFGAVNLDDNWLLLLQSYHVLLLLDDSFCWCLEEFQVLVKHKDGADIAIAILVLIILKSLIGLWLNYNACVSLKNGRSISRVLFGAISCGFDMLLLVLE